MNFLLRHLIRGATVITVLSMLFLLWIISLTGGLRGFQ